MIVQLRAFVFTLIESLRVVVCYYRFPRFALADSLLFFRYFFKSPFSISKRYLQRQGSKNIYQYGPTPLTTLDFIAKRCSILSKDTVYELGCGTGRTALWLAHFVKCKTIGIERIEPFIHNARKATKWAKISNVHFEKGDFFSTHYEQASVLYLYGTLLEDSEIITLCTHLHALKPNTKVITVSYPLTDYDPTYFAVEKQFTANFPWGRAEVYLNRKMG